MITVSGPAAVRSRPGSGEVDREGLQAGRSGRRTQGRARAQDDTTPKTSPAADVDGDHLDVVVGVGVAVARLQLGHRLWKLGG